MKAFGCMVLWLAGVLFMSFDCFSGRVNQSILFSGMLVADGNTMTTSTSPKENTYGCHFDQRSLDEDFYLLEDYRPTKPSPSSKTRVKHGTIYHGSPTIPYVPKPNPPPPSPSPTPMPSKYVGSP